MAASVAAVVGALGYTPIARAWCTCVDGFDYWTEIRDENHYDYTDFPYFECVRAS